MPAIKYVTTSEIIYIHDEIIRETGGSLGIREASLLGSIAQKPQAAFGGSELYPTLFDKVAALFEVLCNYHVFIDGNKRVAAMAMYRFLTINGYNLTATNKELEKYTLLVATTNPDLADIAAWIKKHSKKSAKNRGVK